MLIPALTSPAAFACHCTVETDLIRVGILLLSDEFEAGGQLLWQGDRSYAVHIPMFEAQIVYEAVLPRLDHAAL